MKKITTVTVILACLALLALAGTAEKTAAKPTHKPNPRLAAIAPNSWVRIAERQPAPKGILAYSGGVLDTEHNVYLLFGGGHADYWGNQVCALDMSTLKWKAMYKPDAKARYTNANLDHIKGKLKDSDKPYTRHSYQQMVFVPTVKKMFIWSGCGPGWSKMHHPGCQQPRDAWYYDYKTNKWKLLASNGPGTFGGGTCYDSKRDVIWALRGSSRAKLWKFDVKTSKWSGHKLTPNSYATYHLDLIYSPKQDLIVAAIGERKKALVIDPKSFKITVPDTSTYKPHGGGGMVYLPEQDVAVNVFKTMGVFDFKTRRWYSLKPSNYFKGSAWIYGNCNYSPIDKVIVIVNRNGTWAYKPPKKFDFEALAKAQVKIEKKARK
jgi:hypothetical protein